jgi:hypothetical protein
MFQIAFRIPSKQNCHLRGGSEYSILASFDPKILGFRLAGTTAYGRQSDYSDTLLVALLGATFSIFSQTTTGALTGMAVEL